MRRFLISGAIALIIAMPTPVLALTIQNDLANQVNAELRYEFPANFRQQIETIEARSGAKFYIYAGPYSPDDESLKRSPNLNAGANKAEQLGLSLIGTGDYDADRTTVIAWLRNQDNPVKGSFGVAPSIAHRRAGATSQQLSAPDGLVIPILRRYMPQDPSGAIVAIANNLWTLQQTEQIGGTLLSWFGIGFSAIVIGFIGWYATVFGREIWDDRNNAVADLERRRIEAIQSANNTLYHLKNLHHDQGDYYQRLLSEPDIIQGMEMHLADHPETLAEMETYRAAVTKYSAIYTRMGQFCLNNPKSLVTTTAIGTAELVESTAKPLETEEQQARSEVDRLLVEFVGKYGGFIAYREESVFARQCHIPILNLEHIPNPWMRGESVDPWADLPALQTLHHLKSLSQADDWESFQQFNELIEIQRKTINDRQSLLGQIESNASKIQALIDAWASYTLPDRNVLVGEGTYYSPRDLIDYDACAAAIGTRPNDQDKVDAACNAFNAGNFDEAQKITQSLLVKLKREFEEPAQRLADLMQMPDLRRREIEMLQSAEFKQRMIPRSAKPTASRSTSTSRKSYAAAPPPPPPAPDYYYSSPPPPPPASDDWGGGGGYDSGAGGGDY